VFALNNPKQAHERVYKRHYLLITLVYYLVLKGQFLCLLKKLYNNTNIILIHTLAWSLTVNRQFEVAKKNTLNISYSLQNLKNIGNLSSMSIFQGIAYAIINAFSSFLPISPEAHREILSHILEWPMPSGIFLGALQLGVLHAIFLYFRHDFASLISSFLQVLISRKRPQTLDEVLPFFILLSTLPYWLWIMFADYLPFKPASMLNVPLTLAISLFVCGIPLWWIDRFCKKNKSMVDWNAWDALWVGVFQLLILIPGAGLLLGALIATRIRGYKPEAAAKYAFFAAFPILLTQIIFLFQGFSFSNSSPQEGISWLNFSVTLLVSTLASLLFLGAFIKQMQNHKGFGNYATYRILIALGFFIIAWVQKTWLA